MNNNGNLIQNYLNQLIEVNLYKELYTLNRYHLLSSIINLKFTANSNLFYKYFNPIGLLHFTIQEIRSNTINLEAKKKVRELLNKFYKEKVSKDQNISVELVTLFRDLLQNKLEINQYIQTLLSEFNIETSSEDIKAILISEIEQLLTLLKYSEEEELIFSTFLDNVKYINELKQENIVLQLCDYICDLAETLIEKELYFDSNSIYTLSNLNKGINLERVKSKLNFYKKIATYPNTNQILETQKGIHNKNPLAYKSLMHTLSELKKSEIVALLNICSICNLQANTYLVMQEDFIQEISEEFLQWKQSLNVHIKKASTLEDRYVYIKQFIEENPLSNIDLYNELKSSFITVLNIIVKYQIDIFEELEELNISLIELINSFSVMLYGFYLVFEGNLDEITFFEFDINSVIKRVKHKCLFSIEILNRALRNPFSINIYNIERMNTVFNILERLRTERPSQPQDNEGILLNILNNSFKIKIISNNQIDVINPLFTPQDYSYDQILNSLNIINSLVANYYKEILLEQSKKEHGFSLLTQILSGDYDDEDVTIIKTYKTILDDLKKLGFNNIFVDDKISFFKFENALLNEYLNGVYILDFGFQL